MTNNFSCSWVETLSWKLDANFHAVSKTEHRRKSVRELQNAKRPNNGGKHEEIWDCCGDHIGYRLVDRNEANPDELSGVRRQRSTNEIDEHVVVEDFDPDISVHTRSSESRDESENVTNCLQREFDRP